ncbi:MAG: hypothetical protein ACSLFQ_13700 [Thermoanaerobaculia bacterium]
MNSRAFRKTAAACFALAAALLLGAPELSAAPAECVPEKACQPPPLKDYPLFASHYGSELKVEWIDEYSPMLLQRFSRPCATFSRCLTVWGNSRDFCRDNLKNDVFAECEMLFDRATATSDAISCRTFASVFALSQANAVRSAWTKAQECSRKNAHAAGTPKLRPQPRVVVEPMSPKPGEECTVIVRSYDEDGDAVMAHVSIAGVPRGFTFIPMSFGFAFERQFDDSGRATLVAPTIVVSPAQSIPNGAPPFEPVTVSFETRPSTVRLEVTPPVASWKAGTNKVRVVAIDTSSGEEVRGSLKTIGSILGKSGAPIEVSLEPGPQPCGAPVWFSADRTHYEEADLGVPPCASK